MNRAFYKGATSFSLNKSVNFEGSYDHLKAAKLFISADQPDLSRATLTRVYDFYLLFWADFIFFILFCSFVNTNDEKNVSMLEYVVK